MTLMKTFSCLSIFLLFSSPLLPAIIQTPQAAPEVLPTGMMITATAARGSVYTQLDPDLAELPGFTVDHPVSTAVSPDGNTLLVLTSGYNRNNNSEGKAIPEQSNEYVFVFDIRQLTPVKQQVLKIPNSFVGIAWNPGGNEFYVSGGVDDTVHIFDRANGLWTEAQPAISLGHKHGLGKEVEPMVAGLAVNPSGTRLLAANYENDSVSLVDLKVRRKIGELDLRPGKNDTAKKGVAGGEYPYWAVFDSDDHAYVSSLRDREIVVLDVRADSVVKARIKTTGQPNKLMVSHAQKRLFAALDNSDSVAIIDTSSDRIIANIGTTAPQILFQNRKRFRGSNPNSLALSPDQHTLYVTNGGTNSLAVIALDADLRSGKLQGLIPTGWYPNSVSLSHDGSMLYIVNGKSVPGANPKTCRDTMATGDKGPCATNQQFIWQLEKGGMLILPRPDAEELHRLTVQTARNNRFSQPPAQQFSTPIFAFLHRKIKHVIYIVKENRTYDQVLGDLEKGNGDPALALFKEPFTPNHHQLARQVLTLGNLYDSGEVSGIGWNWSTAARATDLAEKSIPGNAAERGFSYDYEGTNRGINIGIGNPAQRNNRDVEDPDDLLPGTANVLAPDGTEGATEAGYLWDSALRAKCSVRNYGFFLELTSTKSPVAPPQPAASGTQVASAGNPHLRPVTDPYFAGYDQRYPDYWRFKEWEREFEAFVKNDNLPALELVRLPHDHFGSFKDAIDGVNTVETMIGDNDYALGLLVEKVAHSKYSQDTLIFVIEDDAQNGPDHVDAHRSLAFVIGPYVKQGAVVSERYNTVSMLRTIEEILGMKPMGLNDALQPPMTGVFARECARWTYTARLPEALLTTQLPLPKPGRTGATPKPLHDSGYWEQRTQGLDFSAEDRVDSGRFNLALWQGMTGEDRPYPYERSGRDLRNKNLTTDPHR